MWHGKTDEDSIARGSNILHIPCSANLDKDAKRSDEVLKEGIGSRCAGCEPEKLPHVALHVPRQLDLLVSKFGIAVFLHAHHYDEDFRLVPHVLKIRTTVRSIARELP